jgi:hypothetical protein
MGNHPLSTSVFVIDQVDEQTKRFDEHKVMLGFEDPATAMAVYEKAFSDGKGHTRLGGMTKMTVHQFKRWLKHGDTAKRLS